MPKQIIVRSCFECPYEFACQEKTFVREINRISETCPLAHLDNRPRITEERADGSWLIETPGGSLRRIWPENERIRYLEKQLEITTDIIHRLARVNNNSVGLAEFEKLQQEAKELINE